MNIKVKATTAMCEPPLKKPKSENQAQILVSRAIEVAIIEMKQNIKNLQPILSDDFYKPIPLMKVYVGVVKDKKDLSKIILILNEKVPLKNLQHLKRVRKKDVLLCPSSFLNDVSSIQEYLEINIAELKDMFEYFKEVSVPSYPPKIRQQISNQIWPLNFHPIKYYEKLVSNNFFSPQELTKHVANMQMTFEVARWHLEQDETLNHMPLDVMKKINATIVIDPVINSVVAASFCHSHHPVEHAIMLAIDNVAKTQNGGVYGMDLCATDYVQVRGIHKELIEYLKKIFPNAKFGARLYKGKNDMEVKNTETNEEGSSDSPYLCTGYHVYVLREPCFMCSMALVHARAKRIFFYYDNEVFGALKSRTKLQGVSSLNHHFEVFSGFV